MNIPDEVMQDAFGDAWTAAPGKQPPWQHRAANAIAEWARREALREAADAVAAMEPVEDAS